MPVNRIEGLHKHQIQKHVFIKDAPSYPFWGCTGRAGGGVVACFLRANLKVEFIYLVFTRMPGENYGRQFRSMMLCPLSHAWQSSNAMNFLCWFCWWGMFETCQILGSILGSRSVQFCAKIGKLHEGRGRTAASRTTSIENHATSTWSTFSLSMIYRILRFLFFFFFLVECPRENIFAP